MENLLTADEPLINTGVLSQTPHQFVSLWALREGVTEAVSKEGKAYKYDISIPLSTFEDVVNGTREHLRSKGLLHEKAVKAVLGYGHVGDGKSWYTSRNRKPNLWTGNLHLNIVADAFLPEIQDALEPYIYEVVRKLAPSCVDMELPDSINRISTRLCLCRAWYRCDEDPRSSVLQESG